MKRDGGESGEDVRVGIEKNEKKESGKVRRREKEKMKEGCEIRKK